MLPCFIKTPANAEEVSGKVTKDLSPVKGNKPLQHSILLLSVCLLPGSPRPSLFPASFCWESPPRRWNPSGLILQAQTLFTLKSLFWLARANSKPAFHVSLEHLVAPAKVTVSTSSSYLRHPQHRLREGERGTTAPSWPPGAWLVLRNGGASKIFLFFYKN